MGIDGVGWGRGGHHPPLGLPRRGPLWFLLDLSPKFSNFSGYILGLWCDFWGLRVWYILDIYSGIYDLGLSIYDLGDLGVLGIYWAVIWVYTWVWSIYCFWEVQMSDINIQVRVRNGHLLRAIRRTHRNVNAFCVEFGLPPSVVGEILNFKRSPFLANGSLSACAQGICSATGLMPGELWPKEVGKMRLKRSVAEFELSQAEALAICGDSEERLMQRDLLIRWMGRLSPREVELIGMRQAGETYADIGANFGVSPVRVQQIEYSAHKKMRVGAMVDGVRRFSDVVA